jgi:hypothetical protein
MCAVYLLPAHSTGLIEMTIPAQLVLEQAEVLSWEWALA